MADEFDDDSNKNYGPGHRPEFQKRIPKRKSEPLPSADILLTILKKSNTPLGAQFVRWRLWNSWAEVVGNEMAKHTVPVSYQNGDLYIWVKSAARMQELLFLVKPLREKINEFAGQRNWVKSIRFTLDRKSVPKPEETDSDLRQFLAKTSPSEGEGPPPGP